MGVTAFHRQAPSSGATVQCSTLYCTLYCIVYLTGESIVLYLIQHSTVLPVPIRVAITAVHHCLLPLLVRIWFEHFIHFSHSFLGGYRGHLTGPVWCHWWHCTLWYCTARYCTVMCCTALFCIAWYCIERHRTAEYCTARWCTVWHCPARHCIAWYCTAHYCTARYFSTRYCIAYYCIVLH